MINAILKDFQTRDPFVIAANLNITVLFEELGSVKGYFNTVEGFKFIHVNKAISEREKEIVVAHELGHALLHQEFSTPFMQASTYYSINKYEIEANTFAVNLLISDEDILENIDYTVSQMSAILNIPQVLLELRLKNFSLVNNARLVI